MEDQKILLSYMPNMGQIDCLDKELNFLTVEELGSTHDDVENYSIKPIFLGSYIDCYEENQDVYWKNIQLWIKSTKSLQNSEHLYNYLKDAQNLDNPILKTTLEKINELNPNNKSLINFVRYLPVFLDYMERLTFDFSVVKENLRLHMTQDNFHLIMTFNRDFLIDYYSYDDDHKINEKLVYVMKGSFSSSSNLKKSYKIQRLLSLFDRENKFFIDQYVEKKQFITLA